MKKKEMHYIFKVGKNTAMLVDYFDLNGTLVLLNNSVRYGKDWSVEKEGNILKEIGLSYEYASTFSTKWAEHNGKELTEGQENRLCADVSRLKFLYPYMFKLSETFAQDEIVKFLKA